MLSSLDRDGDEDEDEDGDLTFVKAINAWISWENFSSASLFHATIFFV
jgi:hypothetical protein